MPFPRTVTRGVPRQTRTRPRKLMARRNGCTGETEYPNGCTASGYILSTALVVILCVVVPVTHHFRFSNAPPSPSRACLQRVGLTPEEHADALSLYFRYEVQPKSACTFETRILRGCVEDTTSQIGFARYPPGPLRTKNARDIRESFEYVERDFLAVPRRAEDGDACVRPARALRSKFPRLTSPPYDEALEGVPPFSSLLLGENATDETSKTLRYHEYACLAAAEFGLGKIETAARANGNANLDVSAKLASFFADPDLVPGACHLRGDACPGEKDTGEGKQKGSDLGFGACDFVEFADVA